MNEICKDCSQLNDCAFINNELQHRCGVISAYKKGYAKCIWQMSDEFNGLISVFETLYAEQMKGDATDKNRYFVGVDVGEGSSKQGLVFIPSSKQPSNKTTK